MCKDDRIKLVGGEYFNCSHVTYNSCVIQSKVQECKRHVYTIYGKPGRLGKIGEDGGIGGNGGMPGQIELFELNTKPGITTSNTPGKRGRPGRGGLGGRGGYYGNTIILNITVSDNPASGTKEILKKAPTLPLAASGNHGKNTVGLEDPLPAVFISQHDKLNIINEYKIYLRNTLFTNYLRNSTAMNFFS